MSIGSICVRLAERFGWLDIADDRLVARFIDYTDELRQFTALGLPKEYYLAIRRLQAVNDAPAGHRAAIKVALLEFAAERRKIRIGYLRGILAEVLLALSVLACIPVTIVALYAITVERFTALGIILLTVGILYLYSRILLNRLSSSGLIVQLSKIHYQNRRDSSR